LGALLSALSDAERPLQRSPSGSAYARLGSILALLRTGTKAGDFDHESVRRPFKRSSFAATKSNKVFLLLFVHKKKILPLEELIDFL
jgi:hypothetical protein